MSLGKNFEWFNHILFDYLPLLNKFRAPSSILSITAILIPFLGAIGLKGLIDQRSNQNKMIKSVLLAGGITTVLTLLIAFVMPAMSDFVANSDPAYAQQGWNTDGLKVDRKSALQGDAFRSFIYIALGVVVLYSFLKNWIKTPVLLAAIALLVIADEWGIARRYISQDDFLEKRQVENSFVKRPCDTEILNDPDIHYRVHDLTVDPFNSSRISYFHKTIGGYHAAKLQRYQDMIERYISNGDMNVLNMLNTKYFITNNSQGVATANRNASALGNAWFVENVNLVENADEEIAALKDFDPAQTAFIHKEFAQEVGGLDPVKNGSIKLLSYTPNKLTYQSNTSSEQLAVFSEVWYGPNKGWIATIDGEKATPLRANYILRALKVPAGQHEIVFEFKPSKYFIGEWISLVASLGILALVGYALFLGYQKMDFSEPKLVHEVKATKTRKGKTQARKRK
jgi:hypothetical protein